MASENYQSGIKARRRRWGAHWSLGVGNGCGDKEAGSYADIDGSSQQTDRSTPPTAVGTVRRRGHDFEAKAPFELGRDHLLLERHRQGGHRIGMLKDWKRMFSPT